jgi:hypothetical protein
VVTGDRYVKSQRLLENAATDKVAAFLFVPEVFSGYKALGYSASSATNFSASAGLPLPPEFEIEVGFFEQEDINERVTIRKRNATVHTWPLRRKRFIAASIG